MAQRTKDESTEQTSQPSAENKQVAGGVATTEQNAQLEHTKGGTTTRQDVTDMGVPMLPGSGNEPQGPEDALGPGPKRGDYTNRIGGSSYQPHEVVPVENPEPGAPTVQVIAQRPRVEEIGDEAGKKGGVDTI